MKRLACLAVLMAISSSAHARGYSFTFHGHRIQVSAVRHCRSLSCVSLAIPGMGNWHRRRHRDEDVAGVSDPVPTTASPPAQTQPAPVQPAPAPVPVRPAPAQMLVLAPPLPPVTRTQTVAVTAPTLAAAPPS